MSGHWHSTVILVELRSGAERLAALSPKLSRDEARAWSLNQIIGSQGSDTFPDSDGVERTPAYWWSTDTSLEFVFLASSCEAVAIFPCAGSCEETLNAYTTRLYATLEAADGKEQGFIEF